MLTFEIYAQDMDREAVTDFTYKVCEALVGSLCYANNDVIVSDPNEQNIIRISIGDTVERQKDITLGVNAISITRYL